MAGHAGYAPGTAWSAAVSITDPGATTFYVTNTASEGPGSREQAIDDANNRSLESADIIVFRIPGPGPHVIHGPIPSSSR